MIVYWFAEDLINSQDLLSSEVVINFKNVQLKAEKEKQFWRFLSTSNTTIHKIEKYVNIHWYYSFAEIKCLQMIYVLSII